VKPGVEFWQEQHKIPKVELVTGDDPLDVTYDPVFKTLRFSFNIGIVNSGTASDAITGGIATLEGPGPARKQFMSTELLKFYNTESTETSLPIPFFLGTDYQRTLYCVVSTQRDQIKRDDLTGSNEPSRLHLTISGKGNSRHVADLCFYITDEAVSQIFDKLHASFASPNHCGETQ
jgi:hypothetical protein